MISGVASLTPFSLSEKESSEASSLKEASETSASPWGRRAPLRGSGSANFGGFEGPRALKRQR